MSTIATKGFWWNSFRQKTRAITHSPVEGLIALATSNYTSEKPADVGLLVVAYARCLNDGKDLYALVEKLVISNLTYLASVEGMECLVLLAKSYTDMGQPRRAWLMWRRGLTIAQFLGFYLENKDETIQRVWWSIYHGDRFTSLLLGLPHGFSDTYYEVLVDDSVKGSMPAEHYFTLRCAMLAGRVIQRNIIPQKPSFAQSLVLDEEMEAIASALPREWWEVPVALPSSQVAIDSLRERMLLQFYYFHVRTYLHLPFIAPSAAPGGKSVVSRAIALDASRQMLKRFLLLRMDIAPGAPLFECKTSDFVGLTAAVILALCLYDVDSHGDSPKYESDWGLISAAKDIFEYEAQKNRCKMSGQCCATLNELFRARTPNLYDSRGPDLGDIFIPYFGKVSRNTDRHAAARNPKESGSSEPSVQPEISSPPAHAAMPPPEPELPFPQMDIPPFEYAGYEMGDILGAGRGLHELSGSNWEVNPWSDFLMDLDQDWDAFMNET
ncbi:hypothetical protein jhhlp_008260 [Lomentospora prolificans]|uniref:Xylanolytic transcriptional activator regulatory domain-containing protein n=1 Tax=Lomentospora prolificans TaxID=41688 RepID=A0A2N3MXJ9_9PEZI|nr:hypothetical protein jhhlp_008260 [Lomentospora prolificans]